MAPFAYAWLSCLLLIPLSQTPPQAYPGAKPQRVQIKQKDLCCYLVNVENPVYPREARLAGIEGEVRLTVILALDGTVADLQDI